MVHFSEENSFNKKLLPKYMRKISKTTFLRAKMIFERVRHLSQKEKLDNFDYKIKTIPSLVYEEIFNLSLDL